MEKKRILLFLITGFIILAISCNNKSKKKNSEQAPDSATNTKDSVSALAIVPFTLHAYILTVDQQKILFANGDVKEIEFTFESIGKNDYTLSAVGSKGDPPFAEAISNPIKLTPIPGTDTLFTDPAIRNEPQRVTRGDFKIFYKLNTEVGKESEINPKFFKQLTIWPSKKLGPKNSVFFYITLGDRPSDITIQSVAGQTSTNPSPPKNPCDQDCDIPVKK